MTPTTSRSPRESTAPAGTFAATSSTVRANGQDIATPLPCSILDFLLSRGLPPRSVVVEHNENAVAPSEFPNRQLRAGDRIEIVRIVAGG